jgi:DNA polymerase II small subunit/DNA polymerase delta subunit B
MESKQHILAQFLKEGILLSPEALERITESNVEQMLEKARFSTPLVFSLQEEARPSLEVRKFQQKQKLSPQDIAKYYNARFEGLRDILLRKLDGVVSVSNARKSGGQATTIGMIREHTQRGFIIEDTTGWAEVITKAEDIAPDDVIAVKGVVKEEKIFAEEIAWPDIPMSRTHNRPDTNIILSEKDGHKGTVVITPEAVFDIDKKKTSLPNPGWITINAAGMPAIVLVYNPTKPATQKEVLAWLRKRHLSPSREQIRGTEDPFLIEPIPDVVWIVQNSQKEGGEAAFKPWSESYKGLMIVSSNGKVPVKVDLATGEVKL